MTTAIKKRHPLTITYTVLVPEETIQYIKDNDGTLYWAQSVWGFDAYLDDDGTTYLIDEDGKRLNFDTETCLKGIALWIEREGGEFERLRDCETDHTDHDLIWQYGFFGELVYG